MSRQQEAGRIYDYFRKRITFPIANEGGRVIAFTARALESDERPAPKYMNRRRRRSIPRVRCCST